jgi:hypothetical protein
MGILPLKLNSEGQVNLRIEIVDMGCNRLIICRCDTIPLQYRISFPCYSLSRLTGPLPIR